MSRYPFPSYGLILLVALSCESLRPDLEEIIIDADAPSHLWMKTTGDVNNDGKDDMVVGGWRSGGMVAYLAPSWTRERIVDSIQISTDAEICDVNADGINDIVAVVSGAIAWLEGPAWRQHHIDSVVAHDVEVFDFDNDGQLEVMARNQGAFGEYGGDRLFYFDRDTSGNWTKDQRTIPDGEGLKIADIDGDNRMDVIVNAHWYRNTGHFSNWEEYKFTNAWTWPNTFIDVADVDDDGRPDIVHSPAELAGNYYRLSWFKAPEDRTDMWEEFTIIDSVETVMHSVGVADFDLDGRQDVICAEMQQGSDPDEVAIFYNNGDGWEKTVISTGGCHSMQIFDADHDGDPDVFGANFASNTVRLWINRKIHRVDAH